VTTPGIPNEFVLSTTCFGTRLQNIQDQIFAAVGMGFRRLELGLTPTPPTMEGLEDSRRETGMCLRSLLAGCRDASGVNTASTRLGSSDPDERERAMNSVRRHLRLAQAWNCPMVVVRGTRIDDNSARRRIDDLEARRDDGGDPDELHEEATDIVRGVQKSGQRQIESLCRSLFTLMQESEGVKFAIEPGRELDDLLGFEAMGWVLDDLGPQGLGYWHDVGSIHKRESMGLPPQGKWLDAYASKTVGVHLQDASSSDPELPIGAGQVDFKLVAEYLPKDADRVLELHPRHGRAEILSSVRYLLDNGF